MMRDRVKPYVWAVSVCSLGKKEKKLLDKAVKKDYHGSTVESVMKDSINGFCQIWKLGDTGIMVTEIIESESGKFVLVRHLAGKGIMDRLDDLIAGLKDYGRSLGATHIEAAAARKGMQKLFDKKFKEITRIYVEEI